MRFRRKETFDFLIQISRIIFIQTSFNLILISFDFFFTELSGNELKLLNIFKSELNFMQVFSYIGNSILM